MKTIVLSAFALLAVLNGIHGQPTDGEPKQICTPGTQTKVDCNTCTCSRDGTALACTKMECPELLSEFLNPDGSLKLPHQSNPLLRVRRSGINGQSTDEKAKQICTPGTQTKVDCNTCTCSRDGTALSCTRMECPELLPEFLNPDGSLKLPHQSNPLLRVRRSDEEPKQICTPGTQTKVDCNTCTCSRDGTALGCTRMECPELLPEFLNPDGSLKLPHHSNPLLRVRRSGINGQSTDEEPKQICTPGTQTKVDCNTCTCSPDGTALGCTRMECPELLPEFLNPDGSLKLPHHSNPLLRVRRSGINGQSTNEEPKQICTPGTQTKVDCNTCTCSRDGTALGCTRMACPKIPAEFLNPDGSLKLPHQSNPLLRMGRSAKQLPDLPRQRRDLGLRCTPYENFMDDCNHCFCSADGRTAACTMMACPSTLHNRRISLPREVQ